MQEMLFAILILKTMFYVKKIILCFLFNVIFGKGTLAQIGDLTMTSDYDDDICIFFGDQKIYLVRHIIRAVKEAELYLKEYYKNTEYSFFLSNC